MRNHKEMRGSITVFLALILSLLLSMVCTSIESVRMASARTQILNSMDIGLYSVFGQYDKKLLESVSIPMKLPSRLKLARLVIWLIIPTLWSLNHHAEPC